MLTNLCGITMSLCAHVRSVARLPRSETTRCPDNALTGGSRVWSSHRLRTYTVETFDNAYRVDDESTNLAPCRLRKARLFTHTRRKLRQWLRYSCFWLEVLINRFCLLDEVSCSGF